MNKEELITEISQKMEMGLSKGDTYTYCEGLLDDYVKDQTLRIRADFDNYKKRVEREKDQMKQIVRFETLEGFITVLDDWLFFESVISNLEDNEIRSGFNLINNKFKKFLKNSEIEEVDTNCKFNPDLHESVSLIDKGKETGDILNVVSKGYKIGDRIIKYPKVIVQK